MPSFSPTAARMRALAWWKTNSPMSSSSRSACSTASSVDWESRCTAALKVSWPCMWMTCSVCVAQIAGAPRPSACSAMWPIRPPSPLAAVTRPAPAPSANRAAVPRSLMSMKRLSTSAPITSTFSARPPSTCAAASESADRKPVQAAPTSIAPAPCGAQLVGHERRGVGGDLVRGQRGHEHEVDLLRGHARLVERLAPGGHGDVLQPLALAHVTALAHARAVDDPLLGHAGALGDGGVRHHLVGHAHGHGRQGGRARSTTSPGRPGRLLRC